MNFGSVGSALVASKLRVALVGLLVVGAAVGGALALGVLGAPSVMAVDNTFGDVTEETTVIKTDLVVSNPNPIGVGLDGVSVNYTVSMNGIEMAHGEREGVSVASGNSTIDLETALENEAIPPWWTSHVRNDERTVVAIDATVSSELLGRSASFEREHEIETDVIGAFDSEETRPVNADSPLTSDPVLYINETRGEWGAVTDDEMPIDMAFVVYNPNLEPYVITELGYDVTMNDVEMGSGATEREYVIPSHSTETVALTTVLDTPRLDDWWVTHLDEEINGHQVSDLRIEFYAVIELPTGDELTVPLDELTYEETIETDVFDEGGEVGEAAESGGDGEADDEGTDDGDGSDDDTGNDDDSTDGSDDDTDGNDDDSTDGSDDDTGDDDDDDDGGLLAMT
ncbi:LEA type 2 family protein [Halorubrum tibetense]|uniref:LEA type 2 family protein n=1 Tax=Halorubrum tibetense TaxID=175631 RepID=A0ABD5S9F1_9EURY